jgi:hypothetical protein
MVLEGYELALGRDKWGSSYSRLRIATFDTRPGMYNAHGHGSLS